MTTELLVRILVVAAVIGLATLAGRWWQRRQGRVRSGAGGFTKQQLETVGLDVDGAAALAILFGSPTCAPCTTVKRVLGEVERARPGLRWVYVDAADHLDLADAHHVMRVPTLFVLQPEGRILARTSGVPATHDLLAVIDREKDLTAA